MSTAFGESRRGQLCGIFFSTLFVGMKTKNQLDPSLARKCIALLSVLVLAFTVSVELAHSHAPDAASGSGSSQSHCSICAVGHSPALATHVGSVERPGDRRRSQSQPLRSGAIGLKLPPVTSVRPCSLSHSHPEKSQRNSQVHSRAVVVRLLVIWQSASPWRELYFPGERGPGENSCAGRKGLFRRPFYSLFL